MKTKKSILILDNFGFNDATRRGLYDQFAKTAEQILLINFAQLGHLSKDKIHKLINNTVKKNSINFVFWLNDVGIPSSLSKIFEREGIPLIMWYMDCPTQPIIQTPHLFYAGANLAYGNDLASQGRLLPHAGHEPFPAPSNPTRDIFFMGTCWSSTRFMQAVSVGLYRASDRKLFDIREITQLIYSNEFMKESWLFIDGRRVENIHVMNSFSALKRCQHLQNLLDFDLQIYGNYDWQINSAVVAPEITLKFIPTLINSHTEMNALMRNFKVSLNINHLQNLTGGPNFRILDSATHGVAILSDQNQLCREIYPHGEAALYYDNPGQAREYASMLIEDSSLREKLTNNARDILQSGHLFRHRVETFWREAMGMSPPQQQGEIFYLDKSLNFVDAETYLKTNPSCAASVYDTALYQQEKRFAIFVMRSQRIFKALNKSLLAIKSAIS